MKVISFLFFTVFASQILEQGQPENKNLFKIGDPAPIIKGFDQYGNEINSEKILKQDQIVLIFYRGAWCSYCMKHLKEVQKQLNNIEANNGKVIVVTSEAPLSVEKTIENTGATFSIVSDTNNLILKSYGVDYIASNKTVPRYVPIVIEKTKKANHDEIPVLPITGAYVISKSGNFKYVFFNKDYTKRANIEEIIKILKQP